MTLLLLALAAISSGQCGLCHPDVRVEHESSIHARESVGCEDCHGGDMEAVTVEGAHRGDFRGGLSRFDIPGMCAECHSDPEKMRPYNMSTEQYALYRTSPHGVGLDRGDDRVAICTDCHGVHDTLAPENPRSRVFPRRIPETCGTCHGDEGLMAQYGITAAVYQDYLEGRHAVELIQNNNLSSPDCSRCHGVHGATPPGTGDIDKVCGSCHSAARQAYLDGAHAAALKELGNECVSCHGSHKIQMASRDRIGETCVSCHGEDSPQRVLGEKMDTLFSRANEELDRARALIQEARVIPLYVDDYEARLQEARTYLLEAEPAVHTVSITDVERYTGAARSLGEEIQGEIQGEFSDLKLRRLGLVILWFYLILTMAIIFRIRRNTLSQQP